MGKSSSKFVKQSIQKAINLYFGQKTSHCFDALAEIGEFDLSDQDKGRLKKTILLLLVGELFGLHTLNQILDANGISSNNWSKTFKKVTNKAILQFVNATLLLVLKEKMLVIAQKSDSTKSRAQATIVIDDSIFKQWLPTEALGDGEFFAKFFSGQVGKVVYGFRVTLCGMSIGDTFYPVYLELTPKGVDSKVTACEQLKKLHAFLEGLTKDTAFKGKLPDLFLSVDSGFDCPLLLETCDNFGENLPIKPLCVPKHTHLVKYGKFEGNLKEIIKYYFLAKEAAHNKANEGDIDAESFTWRFKGFYFCKKREVTFLVFRLKGSQKVSIIYTTDGDASAKTMRHRWFQRTLIEQFFRFVKDTLKIQQSKVTNKAGFERKLFVFVFKAIQCQMFRNFCRRYFRAMKGWAFSKIRQRITFEGIEKELLQKLLNAFDAVLQG